MIATVTAALVYVLVIASAVLFVAEITHRGNAVWYYKQFIAGRAGNRQKKEEGPVRPAVRLIRHIEKKDEVDPELALAFLDAKHQSGPAKTNNRTLRAANVPVEEFMPPSEVRRLMANGTDDSRPVEKHVNKWG